MERIREEFYKKTFALESEDPYDVSVELMDYLKKYGKIVEKKNVVMTTGPRKKSDLEFFLEHRLDRFTKILFLFSAQGDLTNKTLDISVLGIQQIQMPIAGAAKETFHSWYLKEIYPKIHDLSNKAIKQISKDIERKITALAKSPNKL